MPSTDPNKYILHPFEPLTVPEALLTAVCGLLVVGIAGFALVKKKKRDK